MPVILSRRRVGVGRCAPRVKNAQSADLGTVITYLGERGGEEAWPCAGTWRGRHERKDSGGERVSSGRHFELIVIGPLDRRAEFQPAVTITR